MEWCQDGIHISTDISGFNFLEGSLGPRNITLAGNTFRDVTGCGPARAGTDACTHVCANMSCILAHVDPDLRSEVHSHGNRFGHGGANGV